MPAGDNEVITQWGNDADAQARSGGLLCLPFTIGYQAVIESGKAGRALH